MSGVHKIVTYTLNNVMRQRVNSSDFGISLISESLIEMTILLILVEIRFSIAQKQGKLVISCSRKKVGVGIAEIYTKFYKIKMK